MSGSPHFTSHHHHPQPTKKEGHKPVPFLASSFIYGDFLVMKMKTFVSLNFLA